MRIKLFCLILLSLTSIRCGGDTNRSSPEQPVTTTGPVTLNDFKDEFKDESGESTFQNLDGEIDRKIIRSGSIDVEVQSLDSAEHVLTVAATRNGGYVSNAQRGRSAGETMSGEMEIRVPSEHFEALLNEARRIGNAVSEHVNSTDVTEEFIDLTARANTQRQLEERLLNLLATRKGDLAEIVEIEEKLASVRNEIERIQGRMRFLESQSAMSSLVVRMFEPGAVGTSDTETFGGQVTEAFNEGVDGLVSITITLVRLLMILIPLGLILWLGYRVVRRIFRARFVLLGHRKEKEKSEEEVKID